MVQRAQGIIFQAEDKRTDSILAWILRAMFIYSVK
jgi:hypothetical protein